jgi:hypothetical protein
MSSFFLDSQSFERSGKVLIRPGALVSNYILQKVCSS